MGKIRACAVAHFTGRQHKGIFWAIADQTQVVRIGQFRANAVQLVTAPPTNRIAEFCQRGLRVLRVMG